MKRIVIATLCMGLYLVGCNKEEPAPLPALKPVELPKNTAGVYSGRLPCDDCKMRMARMELTEDSSATVVQTIVTDSMKTDTLKGTYAVNGEVLSLSIPDVEMNLKFKRDSLGNMALMTGAGTIYEDADGMKFDMIRILVPMKKPAQPATDSAEEK